MLITPLPLKIQLTFQALNRKSLVFHLTFSLYYLPSLTHALFMFNVVHMLDLNLYIARILIA